MFNPRLVDKVSYVIADKKEIETHSCECYSTYVHDASSKNCKHSVESFTNKVGNTHNVICDNVPFRVRLLCVNADNTVSVVSSEKSYLLTLEIDQFVAAVINDGVQPGGEFNSEFVWGINSNKIQLVAVGSDLHKDMCKNTEDLKRSLTVTKVKPSDLRVGNIYNTKSGEQRLYLGKVLETSNQKTYYASYLIPNEPRHHLYDAKGFQLQAEMKQKWPSLSLREKFTWEKTCPEGTKLRDKYNKIYISFHSSMNFVSDANSADVDLALEIRENKDLYFIYETHNCYDLAEDIMQIKSRLWYDSSCQFHYGTKEYEAYQRDVYLRALEEYLNNRKKFRDSLKWFV